MADSGNQNSPSIGAKIKCNQCRNDKKRCLPEDREYPAKCARCSELSKPCSPGSLPTRRNTTSLSSEQEPLSGQRASSAEVTPFNNEPLPSVLHTNQVAAEGTERRSASNVSCTDPSPRLRRTRSTGIDRFPLQTRSTDHLRQLLINLSSLVKRRNTIESSLEIIKYQGLQDSIQHYDLRPFVWVRDELERIILELLERADGRNVSEEDSAIAEWLWTRMLGTLETCGETYKDHMSTIAMKLVESLQNSGDQDEAEKMLKKVTEIGIDERACEMLAESFEKTSIGMATRLEASNLSTSHDGLMNITTPSPPLQRAIQYGNDTVISLVLEKTDDRPDLAGRLGLHVIAEKDFKEVYRQIIEKARSASNIDARDICERTPLFLAAAHGNKDYCSALLRAGANIDKRDKSGHTILEMAAKGGHLTVVKLLVEDFYASVNAPPIAYTALGAAASKGYPDVVRYLLEKGADPHAQSFVKGEDSILKTARQLADENEHIEIVQLIEAHLLTLESPTLTCGTDFNDMSCFEPYP